MSLFKISAIDGVYVDAFLTDESNRLVFLSLWGRDTALQELLARLQLPKSDNGIRDFHLLGDDGQRHFVTVSHVDDLEKNTFKTGSTLFGMLTQMWIYDRLSVKADLSNHRALMLYRPEDPSPDLWPLVRTVCPLPLLDHWREIFIAKCFEKQWIRILENGFGMSGFYVHLGDDIETVVSDMIHCDQLTLPETA